MNDPNNNIILYRVLDFLNSNKVEFKKFEHAPVITSEEASKVRNTDLSVGAKALVFIADNIPVMIVVPGDKRIDTNKFKKMFGYKDLYMADSAKLLEVTGLEKGAVPPIGNIFNIKTYMSSEITEKKIIAFNAGAHTISVEMNPNDLIKIVNPILGDFTK